VRSGRCPLDRSRPTAAASSDESRTTPSSTSTRFATAFRTDSSAITLRREAEAAGRGRLGYLPFEKRSAHLFFQLVARRYEKGSMVITTNQVVTQWGTVFGDEVLAAAILDRLLHHSFTLMIQGESYRLKQKRKAGLLGRPEKATN
jgi:hypothetical protein